MISFIFISAFCLRLFLLLQSDNYDGLAIEKTIKAINILKDPSILRNYDSAHTPLPNYLFALALLFWNDPFITTRVVSLLFGSLLVFPFYYYLRLAFDQKTALFSLLIACVYPQHVIYSVLSTGETMFHFFLFSSLYFFIKFKAEASKNSYLMFSAFLLGCATLCRFEGGLFIPLLTLFLLKGKKMEPFLFFCIAMILPGWWMLVSYLANHDPLSFLHASGVTSSAQINLHRDMTGLKLAVLDRILFWPKMLWETLTPAVAVSGFLGLGYSLWKKKHLYSVSLFLTLFLALIYKSAKEELVFHYRYGFTLALLLIPFSVFLFKQFTHKINHRIAGVALTILVVSLACVMVSIAIKQKPIYPSFTRDIGSYLANHVNAKDKILIDTTGDDNFMLAIWMNSKVFERERIFRCPRKIVNGHLRVDERTTMDILDIKKPRFIVYAPEGRFLSSALDFSTPGKREEKYGVVFEFIYESGPYRIYEVFYT